MRRELRGHIGDALTGAGSQKQRDELDCLEPGDDVFLELPSVAAVSTETTSATFAAASSVRWPPSSSYGLLETYVADKAMEFVGSAVRTNESPAQPHGQEIPFSVGHWVEAERWEAYKQHWGGLIRDVVEDSRSGSPSSTAPNRIAEVLSSQLHLQRRTRVKSRSSSAPDKSTPGTHRS